MDCIFCGIAQGRISSEIVFDEGEIVAFKDINPRAPVHILVIPRAHLDGLGAAGPAHSDLLGRLLLAAAEVARREGIAEGGYRVVVNQGSGGGQTVTHLHLHLLGGRQMTWPPG